ncbi:Alpha-(1,3)-fucosyltransferase [Rickettsia canadensis str. McKiel]|uniref:Alpha-(1,3)-fucosyltransferase n=1 Tax=Rickettsia canadensis (strain McKiel) TaxID=293613 RepID=A8EZQ9_RICCK|nr:hypothetical protein [Rickettsia canadensis]ABV73842.1 Alpha-(1,3)-fucosyltransferase [Rickettsia canadensis str. McKiel]
MWPGFTIDELKEIIEENKKTIVIDHNNYELIIDSVFGQRKISNKDIFTSESI